MAQSGVILALLLLLAGAPRERLELHTLRSAVFGNQRALRVYLPRGYADAGNAKRRYPVLYLQDGQNLFDPALSPVSGDEWEADETADRLAEEGHVEPLIVVGIDNAGARRPFEYLPWFDRFFEPPEPRPRGDLYPRFLIEEVKPFVDARYRTRLGATATGVGGSSYGGLISLYAALSHPEAFGRLLVESPSLYVDDAHVLRMAEGARRWPYRVFVAVGTRETGKDDIDRRAVADVRHLEAILQRAGLREKRMRVVYEEGASHGEATWARRLPDALRFLYR